MHSLTQTHSRLSVETLLTIYLSFFIVTFSFSQEPDVRGFYSSDFAPKELNSNSAERIKDLYDEFRKAHKTARNEIDEKNFVYENNYFLDQLNRSGKIFYGNEISKYLNELKDWIIEDEEVEGRIKVYLIDYPYFNAFTNDFGNVYVNIASLAKLNSEEELLYLLAHEISHVILEHSYLREAYIESLDKDDFELNEDSEKFKVHSFSRKNELQADSMAHALLKDRISSKYEVQLMESLQFAENPSIDGPIRKDLLFGFIDSTRMSLHYLWDSLDVELVDEEESDSLRTHPSINKRIDLIKSFIEDTSKVVSYTGSGKFNQAKELAQYVLLNTYIESESFIEGLYLVLKLRESNEESAYLTQVQMKLMMLISQVKYQPFSFTQFYDGYDGQCNSLDYLRFRKFVYTISSVDWNLLSLSFIESRKKRLIDLSEESSKIYSYQYNLLISKNEGLTYVDSAGEQKYYASNVIELSSQNDLDSLDFGIDLDSLIGETEGFISTLDTSYLISKYVDSHILDEFHLELIEKHNDKKKNSEDMLSGVDLRIMGHPAYAAKRFKRGKINKSDNFDPTKKTLLFQTSAYYFQSKNKHSFKVDYEKTLELENQLNEIRKSYSEYYQIQDSNDKNIITVSDYYTNKIIQIWIEDRIGEEEKTYSRVETQFKEFVLDKGIEYLAFTICIVNKNKGLGKKYNLNYYEVYFDILNEGVTYISKIGSRHNPDKFQLEQLIYLSNISKLE